MLSSLVYARILNAASRDVLSNHALSSPLGGDGVVGACAWEQRDVRARDLAAEARTTPWSGSGLNVFPYP